MRWRMRTRADQFAQLCSTMKGNVGMVGKVAFVRDNTPPEAGPEVFV